MLLTSYSRPPVRLRPGSRTDSDGDVVLDWTRPERSPIRGAKIQSPDTTETEAPEPGALRADRRLFAPGIVDLRHDDRIEDVDGTVWRVNGAPVTKRALASGVYTLAALVRYSAGR